VAEKAKMYRKGMSVGDARKKLEELIGPDRRVLLKNHNDGGEAWLSMTSVKKLTAGNTVEKSMKNGFTAEQHYAVASDIDSLYRNAVKVFSHPDTNGNPDVQIHRFAVPLHFDNVVAYITVKENTVAGKRVHSAELMEIKKLEGMLEGARIASHSLPSPSPENETKRPVSMLEEARRVSHALPHHGPNVEDGGMSAHPGNPSGATPSAPHLYTNNIRKLRENVNSKIKKK